MAPRALEPLAGKAPEQFQQRSDLFLFEGALNPKQDYCTVCAHAHELTTAHARLPDLHSRVFDDQPLSTPRV